ncbi:MAG: photosynthetic complex assembly protein PuhC [Pseudomonadota bacterium]
MESITQSQDRREVFDQRFMRVIFAGLVLLVALVAFHVNSSEPPAEELAQEPLRSGKVYIETDPRQGTWLYDEDRELIARFDAGGGGILETMGTVLNRQRSLHSDASDQPVEARLFERGRVTIFDPATGHTYNMSSYGSDNVGQIIKYVIDQDLNSDD